MPSGTPSSGLLLTEIVDIHDAIRSGEIIIETWHHSTDMGTLIIHDEFDLIDLRPQKHKQVVDLQNQMISHCLDKLQEVIMDLKGGIKKAPYVYLANLDRKTAFSPVTGYATGGNVKLAQRYDITLEFHTVPQLLPAVSLTATMNKMAQAFQGVSTALAKQKMSINVNDIPLPHEKLQDMGIGIEPIVGYRDFYASHTQLGDVVLSSRNNSIWTPRKKKRALCKKRGFDPFDPFDGHDAPNINCYCGIYAFDTPDHEDMKDGAYIWGEVYLWGDVLICESGYRAEFAYPKTLFVRTNGTKTIRWLCDELEATYGVPVFLVSEKKGQTLSYIIDTALSQFAKGGEK